MRGEGWSVLSVRACVRACVGGRAREAHRLPQMSQPKPQRTAPAKRPMLSARERKGPWKWNSFTAGLRMRPARICGCALARIGALLLGEGGDALAKRCR